MDDLLIIINNEAVIRDARQFTVKKLGVYKSLMKLQRQVADSTKSSSKLHREVFIKKLQFIIIDTIILVIKVYHSDSYETKYNFLLNMGENLLIISTYIDSMLNVKAINEKKYCIIKEICDNAMTHYSRWFSSLNFKIKRIK